MSDKESREVGTKSTRRNFLKNSGLTVGGLVLGGAVGSLFRQNPESGKKTEQTTQAPTANPNLALMFFYPGEYQTAMAAVERIFPKDELGPGAQELNAAIYIDHQLASQWGVNAKDYMLGPFHEPEPTQGEQIRILRKDLFRLGLKGLDDYSNKHYKKTFIDLEGSEQDEVLVAFEKGEADSLSGVSTADFFRLLRNLTIEGVYADPMYGGNKEMQGWKMRSFPGNKMSFTKEIQSKEFIQLEPSSLHDHMGHS
ncbi:gluconate 2-dehydrogenase subunit 3 family protein [Lederbergia lenta]|uniref:Gluconate 2-dehydrogenase subunit 3 n=1 Tax=Lederbergia lenta TaxID=1467 RepID=A0A2X4VYZ5_LEDLE|nr:gluconate 2-dehydrogenase subunit 3 family protein [Lederbergia lenta]MCM3112374.1 gluconate 2-dehydrogenase subunit 3 family protein [Lederbergia lenta]MEC2326593.1 gluconate 2-dehydrogenase subunit 3 family protein [Lederbergia lenta]SQI53108.1 Gluconate 2-dehydrogenase subunit 3 precursor [Lederbergia lenta]